MAFMSSPSSTAGGDFLPILAYKANQGRLYTVDRAQNGAGVWETTETEVTMAQFCKIVVEGAVGYGSLNKPVPNAKVSSVDHDVVAGKIVDFLAGLEAAMGADKFADTGALFRTAHGFYALAILLHDIDEGLTTQAQAVPALAAIDWTWNNPEFQANIGRNVGGTGWRMNTGSATMTWLVQHCRGKSGVRNVPVVQAA